MTVERSRKTLLNQNYHNQGRTSQEWMKPTSSLIHINSSTGIIYSRRSRGQRDCGTLPPEPVAEYFFGIFFSYYLFVSKKKNFGWHSIFCFHVQQFFMIVVQKVFSMAQITKIIVINICTWRMVNSCFAFSATFQLVEKNGSYWRLQCHFNSFQKCLFSNLPSSTWE